MTNGDIILNIAVNLGRIGRWALYGNTKRVQQFLNETKQYIDTLDTSNMNDTYKKTHEKFLHAFSALYQTTSTGDRWAEEVFTWANILSHRAKLA